MKLKPSFHKFLLRTSIFGLVATASCSWAATVYWDVNGSAPGSGNGGGFWEAINWSSTPDGTATPGGFTAGDTAVFSAGADGTGAFTVNIGTTAVVPEIIVEEAGNPLLISGGTIEIGGGTIDTSALGGATDRIVTIESALAGSGGLTVAAHGDMSPTGGGSTSLLRFSGANTLTGDLTVTSGLLALPTDASFGHADNELILNGGGFRETAGSRALNRNIQIGPDGGTLRTNGSTTLNLNGTLTGTGAINRTDGGTINLNGDGTGYTGAFNVQGGTVRLVSDDWSNTPFDLSGTGYLRAVGGGTKTIESLVTGRDVHIEAGTRLNVESGEITFGTTNFWIQNSGSLTSSSGTLTIDTPTHFNTANDQSVRVVIEDFNETTPLALVKDGPGQINQFDRPSTYTGGTTINDGRITAQHPQALGSGDVVVNSGGQAYLNFNTAPSTNDFTINGLGAVENDGVFGAIRPVNLTTVSGDITVASDSRIGLTGGSTSDAFLTGALLGSANLEINNADATATLADGNIHFSGDGSGYTGTLTVGRGTFNLISDLGGNIAVAQDGRLNLLGSVAGNGTADGEIHLTGTLDGDLVVNDSGILSGNGNIGGDLTLGSEFGAYVFLDPSDPLTIAGDLNLVGTTFVSLPASAFPAGTQSLFSYSGSLTGDASNLQLDIVPENYRQTFTLSTAAPGVLNLQVAGATKDLTWNGSENSDWDLNLTANWLDGASASTFLNGDAVNFTDAAANQVVTLIDQVLPSSIEVTNSLENPYIIEGGGGIGGGASLTKNGDGVLELGGNNTFTGPVAVNEGIILLTSARAFGDTSSVTVAAGSQVDTNAQSAGGGTLGWDYTIAGTGPEEAAQAGAIINSGASTFGATGIRTLTLTADASLGAVGRFDIGSGAFGSGAINGNGFTLTKVGPGDMAFRGVATDVDIVVDSGRLWAENNNLAFGDASGSLTIREGARGGTYGTRTMPVPVTIDAGGILHNQGGGVGTWTGPITVGGDFELDTGGQSIALTGTLSGTGNLTRNGGNVLALQGDASGFNGNIVNNGGTLRISDDAALGAAPAALIEDAIFMAAGTTLQGGTITAVGDGSLHANRGIQLGNGDVNVDVGGGNTFTINGPISDGETNIGNLIKVNNAGNLVLNGTIDLGGFIDVRGGTAIFNETLNLPDNSLRFRDGVVATINSPSGTVGFEEANGGLRLFSSTVNINVPGTLAVYDIQVGEGTGLAGTINHTMGTVDVTADVRIGHWSNHTSVYNISGGSLNLLGTPTSITDEGQANLFLGIDGTGVLNISGTGVVNTNSLILDGRGATGGDDTLTLTGGALNIGALGINTGSDTGSYKINLGGGVLGATASWSSALNMELTGVNGDVTIATDIHLVTLAGILSGSGGFTKTGIGSLTLSGENTYTGATRVNEGELVLFDTDLDDNAEVRIGADAVIDLAHGASDTVRFLYIAGSPAAEGSYGATGSGADNIDDEHFAGTGMLIVSESGSTSPFDDWAASFGMAGANPNDDADGDGLSNLAEFALDGDPTSGVASGKVWSGIESVEGEDALVITLPVRNGATFDNTPGPGMDATVDGVTYHIEGSNDLVNFDQAVSEVTASADGMPALSDGWSYRTFRLDGPVPSRGEQGFLRARID